MIVVNAEKEEPELMLVSSLVLASSSPRRLDLLRSIGIHEVHVIPAEIDETPQRGESPSLYVKRLAEEKAVSVHQKLSSSPSSSFILAADTIITLGRRILQKAESREEALSQILLLSGRRHRVYTGLCLIPPQASPRIRLVSTHVTFKRLSKVEIETFLDSRDWEGVCGYRIQGIAGAFISQINGTPSNIMGLPTCETAQLLHGNGFPLWKQKDKILKSSAR